jgi:hypothetical protein
MKNVYHPFSKKLAKIKVTKVVEAKGDNEAPAGRGERRSFNY